MSIVIPNKIEELKKLLDTLPIEKVEDLRDNFFYKEYIIENNKGRGWDQQKVDFYFDRYLLTMEYIKNKKINNKQIKGENIIYDDITY
jgi:hypothetical protein